MRSLNVLPRLRLRKPAENPMALKDIASRLKALHLHAAPLFSVNIGALQLHFHITVSSRRTLSPTLSSITGPSTPKMPLNFPLEACP